jgi:outer membrane biosynthesis protein TonB
MYEALTQRFPDASQYVQGWGLSLLIHGLAVGVAALMLGDLKLAPQPEPFKWNVAMVEPPPGGQPADSPERAKAAQSAQAPPATKSKVPQPVERQTTSAQVEPTPVAPRQEPVQPVLEKKQEPEVKPETKPALKDVKPDVLPPMPVAAKPVEPVEPVEPPAQHPTQTINTQSAESSASLEKPFIEQATTHAEPAPAHPGPSCSAGRQRGAQCPGAADSGASGRSGVRDRVARTNIGCADSGGLGDSIAHSIRRGPSSGQGGFRVGWKGLVGSGDEFEAVSAHRPRQTSGGAGRRSGGDPGRWATGEGGRGGKLRP